MTTERGLGRRAQFDPRSRNYPVTAHRLVAGRRPRSYTWACPVNLNQGPDGACVGFSWAQELAARPVLVSGVTDRTGHDLYHRARQLDEWEGEAYEGTSVLAGAKAVAEAGHLAEYRWAFGVDDLVLAVGYAGPAVVGIPWYSGMMDEASDGYVRPNGSVVGGHAILVRAYNLGRRRFLLHNSWGAGWGGRGGAPPGCAWINQDDLASLLAADGDACVPVRRA